MKTIGTHISAIRALIKSYSRNQEGYTDEGLYNLFSISRAEILKNELKKFNALAEDNWFQLCMKLEISKSHNCDCVPDKLECKVLKSKYKIPTALVGRQKSKIKIRLISGKVINLISEDDWFRRKDRATNDYFGSIVNQYLVIWNAPLSLKVALVSGIWSEVLDLATIPNCSVDGNSQVGQCFDPLTSMYPLQEEYLAAAYKMTLNLLFTSLQIPQDLTNDSNESIKN